MMSAETSSVTSSELRVTNRRRVLRIVYEHKEISKQDISRKLSMSLPTVTQNLKEFENLGLIERRGLYESTGGRKAQIYCFVSDARISVGVILLKESYGIVMADLYGKILKAEEFPIPFARTSAYFEQLGTSVREFVSLTPYRQDQVLGVSIALQGLVSADGTAVIYGEILDCTDLTLEEIKRHIPYPCTMIHDTEASATAEVWAQKDLKDAVLLLLTRNFGGALIINGQVHRGHALSSSVIEHMRLYPGGRSCYCGKKGCIEAYCSAYALQLQAGEALKGFFSALRAGSRERAVIWDHYLHDLALAISNIRMLLDCEYVIGGYLQRFMEDQDFSLLTRYVNEECPFKSSPVYLRRSVFTEDSAAPGAAIALVRKFLDSF